VTTASGQPISEDPTIGLDLLMKKKQKKADRAHKKKLVRSKNRSAAGEQNLQM